MNPQPNLATPGKPVYRVTQADTLAAIAAAVGQAIREAVRIPGTVRSSYRCWTLEGHCYEMAKSGPEAMHAVRRDALDRVPTLATA